MIQIERVRAGKYKIIGLGTDNKEKNTLAEVDSLEKASCVLRFVNGSSIKGDQYTLAIDAIREIDADEMRMEGADGKAERVSGKADNSIFDGGSPG